MIEAETLARGSEPPSISQKVEWQAGDIRPIGSGRLVSEARWFRADLALKNSPVLVESAVAETRDFEPGKSVGNSGENSVGKSPEIPWANSVGNSEAQQVTGNYPTNCPQKSDPICPQKTEAKSLSKNGRTEWFRYELDFRKNPTGYMVLIRKRLRWSEARHSSTIVKKNCPDLTRGMVAKVQQGKLTPTAIAALENGGIGHGFITGLLGRIGKGNGKRRNELTEHERSLLARIESGIATSRRSRTPDAD